jgi:uncharacterized protein YjbI with pentapeptide repeats
MTNTDTPGTWEARRVQIVVSRRNRWKIPFVWIEWRMEWLAYWLRRWAFLELLGLIAGLSVLASAVTYMASRGDARKQKHYQAWEVINSAAGHRSSGGRIDALQDLVEDDVSLSSIDLSRAWLQGVQIPSAKLRHAVLDSADFTNADLRYAVLDRASLRGAVFDSANLSKVDFSYSVLEGVRFHGASLKGALFFRTGGSAMMGYASYDSARFSDSGFSGSNFIRSTFRGARLGSVGFSAYMAYTNFDGAFAHGTMFVEAKLNHAIFRNVDFTDVNFGRADLSESDFANASLPHTNFAHARLTNIRNWRTIRNLRWSNVYGVIDPPAGFVRWAVDSMGAVQVADGAEWNALRQSPGFRLRP